MNIIKDKWRVITRERSEDIFAIVLSLVLFTFAHFNIEKLFEAKNICDLDKKI